MHKLERNKEIYSKFKDGRTIRSLAKEYGISDAVTSHVIQQIQQRLQKNIPDWLPIRVWNALWSVDLTLEQAQKMPVSELKKLKNMGINYARLISKVSDPKEGVKKK